MAAVNRDQHTDQYTTAHRPAHRSVYYSHRSVYYYTQVSILLYIAATVRNRLSLS